jgi:hypothetical protein
LEDETMKHRTVDGTIAALTLFGVAAVAAPSRAANLDLTPDGQLIRSTSATTSASG